MGAANSATGMMSGDSVSLIVNPYAFGARDFDSTALHPW